MRPVHVVLLLVAIALVALCVVGLAASSASKPDFNDTVPGLPRMHRSEGSPSGCPASFA